MCLFWYSRWFNERTLPIHKWHSSIITSKTNLAGGCFKLENTNFQPSFHWGAKTRQMKESKSLIPTTMMLAHHWQWPASWQGGPVGSNHPIWLPSRPHREDHDASMRTAWKPVSVSNDFTQTCQSGLICPKCPANRRQWAYVGLMLGNRRRRWANIKPTWAQRLLGNEVKSVMRILTRELLIHACVTSHQRCAQGYSKEWWICKMQFT